MSRLLYVPSFIVSGECENLYKVPFHTFGSIKKRSIRLKPCDHNSLDWVDIAVIGTLTSHEQIVKAAAPLALVWGDARPDSAPTSPTKTPYLASPFRKRVEQENEVGLHEIIEIVHGNSTAAFQAFIAKQGRSIPHPSCCFSIVTLKRSVDFFISSGTSPMRDAELAKAMVDSLKTLIHGYNKRQRASVGMLRSSLDTIRQKENELKSKDLFEAARRADLGKLRYLLDNGVPVDTMDTSGDTILILACRLGMFEVCRLALHEYAAKNDPHPDFGQTALQVAVSSGHAKIVKLLLDTAEPSGADRLISNHEDENGEAPLHVAARCGQRRIMKLLLTHGAELGLVDRRGRTCLHCAASSGHASCLAFALDFGADEYIEIKQDNGLTCLHLAIRSNNMECVSILLEAGADLAAETADGLNAFELANKTRNQGIVKLLLEYDVASSGSYSESCSSQSYESSLSGDDMFAGLNTYTVTPAPKRFMPAMRNEGSETPSTYYTANQTPSCFPATPGRFMSPHLMSPSSGVYGNACFFQNQGLLNSYRYGSPGIPYNAGIHLNETQFVLNGEVWTICYTRDGYPYYFNSVTNKSTWNDPRSSKVNEQVTTNELDELQHMPSHTVRSTSAHESGLTATQGATQLVNRDISEHDVNRPAPTESGQNSQELGITTLSPVHQTMNHIPSLNHGETARVIDEVEPTTPSHPALVETTRKPAPTSSIGANVDQVIDPRAALLDALKKRKSPNDEPIDIPSEQNTNTNDDDESRKDPRAALMDMLEKRNPSTTKSSSKKDHEPAPHSKSEDQTEKDPDPRAALVAMLQTRNPIQDESPPAIPKKSVEPIKAEDCNKGDKASTPGKTMSKDDLAADPILKKYEKMLSFGVPAEAVVQKMKQESVDSSKIDIFIEFHGLAPQQKPLKEKPQNIPSKEDLMKDHVLVKYVKMTKVGVPIPAVCSKMTQDNVDLEKMDLFNLAFGLVKTNSPKRSPIPRVPRGRRRASTALQKIHWSAVADESKLKNSVWACQAADPELDETDIQKLESLFAAVQTNRAAIVAKKAATATKDTKKTTLIDPKRANNIAISLAQYRSFTNYDNLVHAVVTLNGQHLNLEKLQNMQILLPKSDEIRRLDQYKGGAIEGLGRAEQFFLAVMKVPRFSQKLSAFIFSLQFEESKSTLLSNLHVLLQACSDVVTSTKLALILRRLLAIGNVLNESAGKPAASGITLDSLLTTARMRGSDGKTTILDSVISSRLDLAEVCSEMSSVRDAMRLDLVDLKSNLSEIEAGLNGVKLAIQAEKADVDSSEDGLISEASEKFLQKLEPFVAHAVEEVTNIKASFAHAGERVRSLCSFFAEDYNTKASTIFGVLLEFSQFVERSAEQLKRREAVAKRRESLRTPVKASRH